MKFVTSRTFLLLAITGFVVLGIVIITNSCLNQTINKYSMSAENSNINFRVLPFDLTEVELLDGPFKQATELNIKTLLSYEPDRFLSGFRTTAGLKPKANFYGGWESETLAGHSLGHYLSACALMYHSSHIDEFKKRVDYMVDELYACQQTKGTGYIGALNSVSEIFEKEIAKGNIRSQGFDLNGLWAPIYTQHKVIQGLIDANQLLGNQKALEVAVKFADWLDAVVSGLNEKQMEKLMVCEIGGISEAMANLSCITKNEKYLKLANKFYHKQVLDPLSHGIDCLAGKHANTQIPKIIGLSRLFEISGDSGFKKTSEFFFDRVVNHHSYVTGGNGNHEYFGSPDTLSNMLSQETTESCNVYNMLKLSQHLFTWDASASVADYYERALFNHILASQNPDDGHVVYNLALEMGGYKEFQDPNYFTCCIGTAMESHSKYGQNIYFYNNEELFVFQYIASKLNWKQKDVIITQETQYPESQKSVFHFSCKNPARFAFNVRYPNWCKNGFEVLVNGKRERVKMQPGCYVSINRKWKNGDVVEVKMPFELRYEPMPDNKNRIALMNGPLVLAGELGSIENPKALDPLFVPVFRTETLDPKSWVIPVEGKENYFKTVGVGYPHDVTLKPLYLYNNERYSVFWDVFTEESWKEYNKENQTKLEEQRKIDAKTIDFFQPGEMQPERDHNFKGENLDLGILHGRKYRLAYKSWMSCDLKIQPQKTNLLLIDYWGAFTGSKTFDVFIDDTKIATENLSAINKGLFLTRMYEIPQQISKSKNKITIRFVAHNGHRAGPVFGVRTILN